MRDAPDRLDRYKAGKGHFDVGIEATGAVPALATLFDVVRAGGVIVQVGMLPPGEVPVPANKLMAREIDYVGAFRFHGEYGRAVRLLARAAPRRRPDPDPRPAARARRGGVRARRRPDAVGQGQRSFLIWRTHVHPLRDLRRHRPSRPRGRVLPAGRGTAAAALAADAARHGGPGRQRRRDRPRHGARGDDPRRRLPLARGDRRGAGARRCGRGPGRSPRRSSGLFAGRFYHVVGRRLGPA